MSAKEISVFILGIMLVGFLYLMKHPSVSFETPHSTNAKQIIVNNSNSDTDEPQSTFNPDTKSPILESILDIPALQFDVNTLAELTGEELVNSINKALDEERYFQPEQDNVLYYLVNLKAIHENNENIGEITSKLNKILKEQELTAIEFNDEKKLIEVISRSKTLNPNNPRIKQLKSKLTQIKTINKLYAHGHKQILNNQIISADSHDAWHTAKQSLEIDPNNHKTIDLVKQVNNILINNALRAAEETDFKLAQDQIQQAHLLDPDSTTVVFTEEQIAILKQQRYLWLEQQINIAIKQINIPRAKKMLTQLADLGIQPSQLEEYQKEIDRIVIFGKYSPFETFVDQLSDTNKLPTMVVMPIGEFLMGSDIGPKHGKPKHKVTFNYGFAISQNEISMADFKLFMLNSDYKTDAEKSNSSRIYDLRTGRMKNKNRITWQKNYIGKKAKEQEPVIHVSWNDAIAYTQWLSKQTGKKYRLPTEAEFEYVLRAGSNSLFPWGEGTPTTIIENLTGKLDKSRGDSRMKWEQGFEKYNDKFWGPAPVASFTPNPFKLNDTAGNVMEWVMDCWHDSYIRAPIDGSSWTNPGCEDHVIRGGSWSNAKSDFVSSHRFKARANFTDARLGFRIAVDLK